MKLDSIFDFIRLTHQFQKIERVILIGGSDRNENDLEHSYQLALLAWYIVEHEKLSLNKELTIKYALVHDLVEAYAGDTFIFSKDETHIKSKKEREEKAAEKLKKEFPKFKELHELIIGYEKREDPESRFVYALDKVIPLLNIYLDGGRTWKAHKVNLEMLLKNKSEKVEVSPEVKKIFDELVTLLKKEEKKLF